MTPNPINMTDEYQTRNGEKRRVLCVDAPGGSPVIAIDQYGVVTRYLPDGRYRLDAESSCDLQPVPKKHKRTVWLAHFENGSVLAYQNKANVDYVAIHSRDAIAITGPHEIDFTEGEGLAGAEGGA